jgi:acyl transferase domain-containing protein/3-hydroxymyristoyl/3-hydroxydecanoyl-(acyl carrier protein) dehydratase
MGFSQLHALSPSGTCSPFDANGDGLVVGEGSGMFLLKRTEDAVRAGDHIYAVIRGIGLSNDIGGSLLAPASEGQLRAMRSAYQQAGWSPSDVDMIECHATGTPVGDVVEFSSLNSLWGREGWQSGQCVIGSVKSNIGHLLTAAGSAALMKTLLAMKERTLPPTANFAQPAKGVELEKSPFRVLQQSKPWKQRKQGQPRRAAVSAFGFGGINAHLLVEEWIPKKPAKSSVTYPPSFKKKSSPVAIVGMGAHLGPWDSLDSLRSRFLGDETVVMPELPSRWWGAEESRWFKNKGFKKSDFKGFYVSEARATPGVFRIPPKEVEEMLPRQLLMLKVADEALQDAGIKKEDLLFTGVFIGTGLDLNATNFSFRWGLEKLARRWAQQHGRELSEAELNDWIAALRESAGPALSANRVMGALGSIVASRVGPSFTLSSEENSGLRALEVGVRALQEGSINRAIVGAADMAGDLRAVLGRHENQPFSKSGVARPFDKNADGPLVGEGAAAVILKRLDDAKQDGDHIYAVIKGVGTATGGRVEEETANIDSYSLSVERAIFEAGASPESVSYLETHGSGLASEDVLEAKALGALFGAKQTQNPCYIGSSKADVGHTGSVAGLASLIKASLCLETQLIPPMRNLQSLRYDWVRGKRKFIAPDAAQFWLRNRIEGPRRALVSGLGNDGTCSHVVLEGFENKAGRAQTTTVERPLGPLDEGLFVLEADNVEGLLKKIAQLQDHVAMAPDGGIEALAMQWYRETGLGQNNQRCLAMVASNRAELLDQLDYASLSLRDNPDKMLGGNGMNGTVLSTSIRDRLFYAPSPLAGQGKVAFIFPGSGNHFAGMGRDLSARWPAIYSHQDGLSKFLARQFLPESFWKAELTETLHDDHNALVIGQVALGTAVSDLVRSFGVEPSAVSGYSLGESAGLFSFGAWKDRDGMSQRLGESTLFTEQLAGDCKAARKVWNLPENKQVDWVLGLVDAPAVKVKEALVGKDRAYLLIINTHNECVVGGDRSQIEALAREVNGHFFPLRGVTTVHCEVAEPVAKPYRDLHLFPVTAPDNITFYSCNLGKSYKVTTDSAADVILGQALETVDYTKVIEQAYADGVRIFLEMGPGNSCSRMIGNILEGKPHMARAACYPGQKATSLILSLLANCLAERVPVNLDALYPSSMMVGEKESGPWIETVIGGRAFEPPKPPEKFEESSGRGTRNAERGGQQHVDSPFQETAFVPPPAPSSQHPDLTREPLVAQMAETAALNAATHEAYLKFASTMEKTLTENINLQMSLLQKMAANGEPVPRLEPVVLASEGRMWPLGDESYAPVQPPAPSLQPPMFNREMCMEFAIGSIASMLGPEFAEVDTYPTRVRLPDEPLMLVDRIMTVEGEPRSMTSGRVVTEHDVTADRWYLDGGRIPTCVAVEAGQADLFLSGYLGIDFISKGKAVYRLLDAVVTFHRGLPVPGDVIRYDIKIDHFFRQDQTYLFRFNFEGTVNGEPLLSMQKGVAGFFTEQELAAGKGIVHTKLDLMPQPGIKPEDWRELAPLAVESYDAAQVDAIYAGDLGAAFGELFTSLKLAKPYTLPGGYLKLVDRVIELDPQGGRYGLGQIRAEMDISPEDWFLTCHFCDDNVMPGTLMYECCMHTLRIYLLRMGWVGEEGATWCEPIPGVDSGLKCRGQVIETTKTVTYQVSIKELGYGPEPFAIVDALMFADGKPIVEIPNMSIRLAGLTRDKVEGLWGQSQSSPQTPTPSPRVLYDYEKILAFSDGNPSEAFGEPYKVFDKERKIARLPRPPFQFLDRIVDVTGEAFKLVEGASCEAEYDVPPDAWYFQAGRQPEMPFSVLLETGLQPCGWLAAYLGSALTSQTDLKFRNLDGNAVQHRSVTPHSGTLTTRVKITRISSSGGMIIQGYDFEISDPLGPVYTGDTVFGFFSAESLAQQVGVRDAKPYQPTAEEVARGEKFDYPSEAPFPETKMRMLDNIDLFVADGGPEGLGYIRGSKAVDPAEWFFDAHFYQDPVCPGSLGLESFLQLLKVAAVKRWGGGAQSVLETIALGEKHSWNYRGQIIPSNGKVTVEAVVTSVDDDGKLLKADGFLSVDGKIIYQMKDFSLRFRSY